MADHDSDQELNRLSDIMFFGASAGACFVLAMFCVITPFFLSSDLYSSLLLLGFFVFAAGTIFFGLKSWDAERDLQELVVGSRLTR
jgi:hypothetical protein